MYVGVRAIAKEIILGPASVAFTSFGHASMTEIAKKLFIGKARTQKCQFRKFLKFGRSGVNAAKELADSTNNIVDQASSNGPLGTTMILLGQSSKLLRILLLCLRHRVGHGFPPQCLRGLGQRIPPRRLHLRCRLPHPHKVDHCCLWHRVLSHCTAPRRRPSHSHCLRAEPPREHHVPVDYRHRGCSGTQCGRAKWKACGTRGHAGDGGAGQGGNPAAACDGRRWGAGRAHRI